MINDKNNNVINELRETILNENNSVLSEEEFNEHVKKLDSIFEVEKDDELEVENKKEDKVKNLRETLDKEFDTFKKYNKDKNLDKDYAAFYHAVTLLDSDQKEKLKQYVEEDPAEAIGYIIQIGQDYREDLEEGLNKHKNIFAYVSHLKGEIKRLNEEVKNKENIKSRLP